ncbi:hypothetical protein OF377_02155 [Ureaplasma sp. ES3154-GEN]|uniref:hypothetical protein n=1 Tax=Ureaplasma sp. ES3154-GEN TaxID=2984844 RepID=UPI0021E70D4D|nr:hypothetical protein [Ureaplasma sp. ES3154-GEN]MCV3743672.1 hypothetical protein [Ureaplasma sp. ES3154-GEN]
MKSKNNKIYDEIASDDILNALQNQEQKIQRKKQSLRWWEKLLIVLGLIIGSCLCIVLLVALIVHLETNALF